MAETTSRKAGIAGPEAIEEDCESLRGTGDANVLPAETIGERAASETRSQAVVGANEAKGR